MPWWGQSGDDGGVLSMREVKLVSLFRRFNEQSQLGLVRTLERYVENPSPAVGIGEQIPGRTDLIDYVVELLPEFSDEHLIHLVVQMSQWLGHTSASKERSSSLLGDRSVPLRR